MRAFRYRLAPMLKRAQHTEQSLQVEVARLDQSLAQARRRWKHLRRRHERLQARLRTLQSGEIDLARLSALGRETESVEHLLDQAAHTREEVEAQLEATRRELLEAVRARQVLEHHRDMLAQRHHREEMAGENRLLDELSTTRFAHSSPHLRSSP